MRVWRPLWVTRRRQVRQQRRQTLAPKKVQEMAAPPLTICATQLLQPAKIRADDDDFQ
ncbi:hypothetical protein FBU59_007247 [Linderina macrospora]|uniref:Uncharacterized protein n=1 Tax=Linderina macrospora TaxID=4868 RepID=A0ACC1IXN5_9FUNG|nr:hypothetical protein FBU59_007247 [Linderina macrospora]